MQATDVGAAAINAIHNFEFINRRRPHTLFCGPFEMLLIEQSLDEAGEYFFGIPIMAMDTPGIVAK